MTDSLAIREHILAAPQHVERAAAEARGLEGIPDRSRIQHIVAIATGDDAAAGDIVQAVASPFVPMPINVVHDYELPAYVGDGSLVLAFSTEGDVEEIIDVTTSAVTQGATAAIIGGGQLAKEAIGWGAPVLTPPPDTPKGRAAVAYASSAALSILEDIGIFPGASEWIRHASDQLEVRKAEMLSENNRASQLAEAIGSSIPLFAGGGIVGTAAARRWKTSVNLNAQAPAFWTSYPEAAHIDLAGWWNLTATEIAETAKRRLFVVNLRHDAEHPQIAAQFAATADKVRDAVLGVEDVNAEGEGEFAQLLDLVLLGDMTSLYVAEALDVDPGPIPI